MGRCLALFGVLSFVSSGCSIAGRPPVAEAAPCGTFTVREKVKFKGGVRVVLGFLFNNQKCKPSEDACPCETVVYVQMIRATDEAHERSLWPEGGEYHDRMVTDSAPHLFGWMIDRIDGQRWGYYGRYDDDSFNAASCVPGTHRAQALLKDKPSCWDTVENDGAAVLVEVVSMAVCIDAASPCNFRIGDLLYWGFEIRDGNTNGPYIGTPTEEHLEAFARALQEWNNDAPRLRKEKLPDFFAR